MWYVQNSDKCIKKAELNNLFIQISSLFVTYRNTATSDNPAVNIERRRWKTILTPRYSFSKGDIFSW